jgi:pimeloyl-ACP methyl ester carboxylesterase
MRPKIGKNNQQWIFDYVIRTTGKTGHWELDALLERLPPEVKSWDMIPKVLGKKAAREEEFGRKAEEAGHILTAWEAYNRACRTYLNAQHVICEDDNSEKIRLYGKLLSCHEKVRKYSEHPIEKLEIPWGSNKIPALLHLVPDKKKAPCVIYVPGMDQTKETFPTTGHNTLVNPNPFIRRGINVLSVDFPGLGECNLMKIRATLDNHIDAGKAVIDYLMTRPEVDSNRIGLYGISMGSFWGSRIAAHDDRIKACLVATGCFMMERHPIFEEASPRFRLTFKYMTGIQDDDEFDKMVAGMTLKGIGSKIKCPTLVWVGEFDPLSPLQEAELFFESIAGPKEMWIMEDDFHNSYSRGLCDIPISHIAADWLKDKLEGKYPKDMARKVRIPLNGRGPYTV